MDLPSFAWLWKIAAWSMGLALWAYVLLALSGSWLFYRSQQRYSRPLWLKSFHYLTGLIMVGLVLLLLLIGIVGTLGHYGSLGHSTHLWAGAITVVLVLISAVSATQISPQRPWMRSLHITINLLMLGSYIFVTLTGWDVVQKYLP